MKQRYKYLLGLCSHFAARWKVKVIVLGLLAFLALLALAFWPLPQCMVRLEYWEWSKHPNDYAKLVDDYRKTLVQIIGGAFLLYGLYLTQRRTTATEKTLLTTQESLRVTRETQVTDRFTKAISQLGATDSQGKKQLEIRFGGIYSLERIAKDSPEDHWPIMEILTAYVRENSPWQEPDDENSGAAPSEEIPPLAKDIQAIMTVISRRNRENDKEALDLTVVDLRRATLAKAHLEGATLVRTNLQRANLPDAELLGATLTAANFEGANLVRATLMGANLPAANLAGASLWQANLEGANLAGASLWQANLEVANLAETFLWNANLAGANLAGADLRKASLGTANLSGANLGGARLFGANLAGANLSGANLDGTFLWNANLEKTRLIETDLSKAEGLTQDQIDRAHGDHTTKLPAGLAYPDSWPKAETERSATA